MATLIIGGGGREHALAWALARGGSAGPLYAAPGNPGIAAVAECVDLDTSDAAAVAAFAERAGVSLVVVGPEGPLVAGLADGLIERGVPVFGPSAAAARIEGSKAWAKDLMHEHGIPTSASRAFRDAGEALGYLETLAPPYVVKADGLAAGKGVRICDARAEAEAAVRDCLDRGAFGEAGAVVVIEEFMEGDELSLFALTDGKTVLPLAEARDFKRALDGDAGPNTGGMGAYSPVPGIPADALERARAEILEPAVAALDAAGATYRGLLYAGLMLTADGPKVVEFNCRFGDPETQVVLPRLDGDLAPLLRACADGTLASHAAAWRPEAAVEVVLASGGYPGPIATGVPIEGVAGAEAMDDVIVFHAGTARSGGGLATAGGRVLGVTALGPTVAEARERAYEAVGKITFDGMHYRTDIAASAG